MNQPAPSIPMSQSQSPRQYPANLPNSPQYAMSSQQLPPFPPAPYGVPPMPPYFTYINSYQMAGPSNQMMSYPVPPPYYPPPPHHYMYPLSQSSQPHIPFSPSSPRQFESPRASDLPRQNGGSPHRGPRNYVRNNNTHLPHLSPAHFRPASSRPAKLASPAAPVPSSPFPLQTTASHLPPVVNTAPPPVPDIPPVAPDNATTNTDVSHDAVMSGEASTPTSIFVSPAASPSPPVEHISLPKLDGLTDISTAPSSANPRASYAILNSRPDDPSRAYGLMFSHSSKPPQSVLRFADHVEDFEPRIRIGNERFSGPGIASGTTKTLHAAIPNKHMGVLIPAPEPAPPDEADQTNSPVPEDSEPMPANSAAVPITPPIAVVARSVPPGGSEKSLTAPVTPTLSSSVQSSTVVTPISHTPSPSSPISTATSISTYPSPSVSKAALTSAMGAPAALAPSKSAPRLWADLFTTKPSTPSKLGAGSSQPKTESSNSDGGIGIAEDAHASNAGTGVSAESAPPASASATTAGSSHSLTSARTLAPHPLGYAVSLDNFGETAVPPLHILLTSCPPLHPPAPLTHPRGLVNMGNMCFANVVMQALLHTPLFYKLFEMIGHTLPGDLGRRALVDATVIFLRDFPLESTVPPPERPSSSGTTTPLSPEQLRQMSWQDSFTPQFLYDAMSENKRFDSMRGGRQEDAEEFLGFFLDTLHEELLSALSRLQANPPPSSAEWAAANSAPSPSRKTSEEREVERPLSPGDVDNNDGWLEVGKKNKVMQTRTTKARDSAITRIFGGKLRSTLHTPGSGKDSVTLEPYQPLQLDIQPEHVHTIEDAMRHLTQPETVQVHSGVRGALVDVTKQVLIESLPPTLVVHVKRFLYDLHGGVQKSNKPLLYKTILEVPRDVLSPTQRSTSPRYRLYAVIYHHGKSASGGHYTIDLLRQDHSEWLRIDDTQIEVVAESDVTLTSPANISDRDRTAYLLFYQRIPDNSAASSTSHVPSRQQQHASQRKGPTLSQAQKGKATKV